MCGPMSMWWDSITCMAEALPCPPMPEDSGWHFISTAHGVAPRLQLPVVQRSTDAEAGRIADVDAALCSKRREKNGMRARQYLWPSMRHLTFAQRRNGFWLATRRRHTKELRPWFRVGVEHDGLVVTPRSAARMIAVDVADGHGTATRDRYLLQLAVRGAEESNPLAVRRKEWVADRARDQRKGL